MKISDCGGEYRNGLILSLTSKTNKNTDGLRKEIEKIARSKAPKKAKSFTVSMPSFSPYGLVYCVDYWVSYYTTKEEGAYTV